MDEDNSAASPYGDAAPFIAAHRRAAEMRSAAALARKVRRLVERHDWWRRACCLNLTPAENTISRQASRLLDSDLATRVTEGIPGNKDYPADPQNRYVDAIEGILIAQIGQMFDAPFVEWRPVSTSMANAVAMFALARDGRSILVQGRSAGGNYSYLPGGTPQLAKLRVHEIPACNDLFDLDLAACSDLARQHRPDLIFVGGSYALCPSPIGELAGIAREVGARLVVDMAHSALFAASGRWPNPLDQGADLITFSTHKVMGGPVGGAMVTRDPGIAEAVLNLTFPTFMQTRDQNKYAAAAHAMCEMGAFGGAYADAMIDNARALGQALADQGLRPLGEERGFSQGHLLVVDLAPADARAACASLRAANILVSAEHLAYDKPGSPSGTRLTVQEITRRGFDPGDMRRIAQWMSGLISGRLEAAAVADEVVRLTSDRQAMLYSFDDRD